MDNKQSNRFKWSVKVPIVDTKYAVAGGIVAAAVAVGGGIGARQLSAHEANQWLDAIYPSVRFFSSGVMASASTILALMLTLLSLSSNTESQLKPVHFRRIKQIAAVTTAAFILSVLILLTMSVPIEESAQVSAEWYSYVYYGLIGASSVLGGMLVTVVLMLYNAVRDIISVLSPADESNLTVDDDNPE